MPTDKENSEGRKKQVAESERTAGSGEGEFTYYYSRDERLQKLRAYQRTSQKKGFFSKKKNRILIIILLDALLLFVLIYFLNKPANVYVQKKKDKLRYELNITEIKGDRVLVGFTINNQGRERIVFGKTVPVSLKLTDNDNMSMSFEKLISADTIIYPGESNSTTFIIDKNKLPPRADLEVYYHEEQTPLFSVRVNF